MLKAIGCDAGDPKHVLQDESIHAFLTQVMCFAGLYQSVMPQK